MSYQERSSTVSIFTSLLIYAAYLFYVFIKFREGSVDMANDLRFWGIVILIFVPIAIVVRIVIIIIFTIVNTILTQRMDDPSFEDERDKIIGLKTARKSIYVVGFGFLLSLVTLVLRWPPAIMINIIYFSFVLSDLTESVLKIISYRRGV